MHTLRRTFIHRPRNISWLPRRGYRQCTIDVEHAYIAILYTPIESEMNHSSINHSNQNNPVPALRKSLIIQNDPVPAPRKSLMVQHAPVPAEEVHLPCLIVTSDLQSPRRDDNLPSVTQPNHKPHISQQPTMVNTKQTAKKKHSLKGRRKQSTIKAACKMTSSINSVKKHHHRHSGDRHDQKGIKLLVHKSLIHQWIYEINQEPKPPGKDTKDQACNINMQWDPGGD